MGGSLIQRLDAQDRALFARWALQRALSTWERACWVAVTHVGSAWCTIGLALLPLTGLSAFKRAGTLPLTLLVVSHLVIQGVKRTIGRPRPSRSHVHASLVVEPDRFSFPSGHSAAAMSVALGFAYAAPELSAPLVMSAVFVGLSRVVLGVHFPGDVFVGQLIALLTAVAVVVGA
jgi:undecaprenyl-diphosphatase